MNERYRIIIMKALSTIAVLSFVYPVIMTVRFLVFKKSGGLLELGIISLISFSGFLSGKYTIKEKPGLLSFMSYIIPVLFLMIIYFNSSLFIIVFECIAVIIAYTIGLFGSVTEYDVMLNESKIGLGAFLIAFVLIINYFMFINRFLIIFVFIFMILSFIIRNQASIDRIFLKMNRQISGISSNIRSFNMKVIALFFICLIFTFNFRWIIAFFMNKLSGYASKFAGWVISEIPNSTHKMSLMKKSSTALTVGHASLLENLIIGIIYLIIFSIPVIILFLIVVMLKNMRYNRQKPENVKNDEYIDETEYSKHTSANANKVVSYRDKRSFRKLKQITDPVQKIRYIYGFLLENSIDRGVKINKTDTTGEIKLKVDSINLSENFEKTTIVYDEARYGEKIPVKDQIDFSEKCCLEVLKGR